MHSSGLNACKHGDLVQTRTLCFSLINSIAVDEAYEWLAPLSNRVLNLYLPTFMTTTGWITLESPIKFSVILDSRLSFQSHIEVWCFPLQILQVFLLLQSLAWYLAPVQLKHKRLSSSIFFLSSMFWTLSQLIALCCSLHNKHTPLGSLSTGFWCLGVWQEMLWTDVDGNLSSLISVRLKWDC